MMQRNGSIKDHIIWFFALMGTQQNVSFTSVHGPELARPPDGGDMESLLRQRKRASPDDVLLLQAPR
jgi:hypothetical protein